MWCGWLFVRCGGRCFCCVVVVWLCVVVKCSGIGSFVVVVVFVCGGSFVVVVEFNCIAPTSAPTRPMLGSYRSGF